MIALTEQLAVELGPAVRVNAIAPAVVKTRFAEALYVGREDKVSAGYPLKRLGEPEDIAARGRVPGVRRRGLDHRTDAGGRRRHHHHRGRVMRARGWSVGRLGEPGEVLELTESDLPDPQPGQVLLRVRACALNFPDVLMIRGQYQDRPPLPFTPGIEFCGDVLAAPGGPFPVGSRVIGGTLLPFGALAEYALAETRHLHAAPPSLDDARAASFTVAYQTAWMALDPPGSPGPRRDGAGPCRGRRCGHGRDRGGQGHRRPGRRGGRRGRQGFGGQPSSAPMW